jgi:malonate-semialdehyde dehydrogenase (acetylating)/methylmalonate-semialdehyde dehydrogenase
MFKYQALIKENLKEIAKLITFEQGKTIPDAEGDVMRGLQVNVVIVVVVIIKINITVL